MAMKYLADTNIFLEVLLAQNKKEDCKSFLESNKDQVCLSDFSLHSIGVILYRQKEFNLFDKFILDIQSNIEVLSLSQSQYVHLSQCSREYLLDFDDTYQFAVAKEYDLIIKTQDRDFEKVIDKIRVEFLFNV
jgi:predicted nucleic acid-binding protein